VSREKGRSLVDTGYSFQKVVIYRGAVAPTNTFTSMDYVTRSRKFAIGHAEHIAAVEEEPANVLKALVKASDVYEAYNAGEYFYDGPDIVGTIIQVIPAFDPNNHRRNPDDKLRRLERQYASSPTEELRSMLNAERLRAGLKLVPSIPSLIEQEETGEWVIKAPCAEGELFSIASRHHTWWGIDHQFLPPHGSSIIPIGRHRTYRFAGQISLEELHELRPTLQQVAQAHLELAGLIDTYRIDPRIPANKDPEVLSISGGELGDLQEGHQFDFSIYDLSDNPLREFVLCSQCNNRGVIYCRLHPISLCREHTTPCEEPDCNSIECPQCSPKCDVCEKPACAWCTRETICGRDACTRPDSHCWDFCGHCDQRICKRDAKVVHGTWYCSNSPPCYDDSPYANQ